MQHIRTSLLLIPMLFFGCQIEKDESTTYISDRLQIVQISDHIYQHTSFLKTMQFGTVPCNGMIFMNGNEAIVFDTPVTDAASSELIQWIGNKTIKAVVVTHYHIDCLGGLEEFHANEIASYATSTTIEYAKESERETLPQNSFDNQKLFKIGNEDVYARFVGPGHTKDNIIGYVPSERALFGGCMIKSMDAPKGNLADADTSQWATSVRNIRQEFPSVELVIPGHGKYGGTELLDYTVNMFDAEE